MRTARPKSLLERSAEADLWRHTLSQIPVIMGQLVYLAGLRRPTTGRYEHYGMALLFGEMEAEKAIRASHRKVFQDWLVMPLEAKVDDLASYLASCGEDPLKILKHWSQPDVLGAFHPAGAQPAEKALFASDLRGAIRILSQRFAGGAPDQSA